MAWSKDELRKIAEAEQTELSLVSSRVTAEGGTDHCRRNDEGGHLPAGKRGRSTTA